MMINWLERVYIVLLTTVLYELNGVLSAGFISGFPAYVVDSNRNERLCHSNSVNSRHGRTKKSDDSSSVALFERDRQREQGFRRKRQSDDLLVGLSDSSSRRNDATLNLEDKPPRNTSHQPRNSNGNTTSTADIDIDLDLDLATNSPALQQQNQKSQKRRRQRQRQQQTRLENNSESDSSSGEHKPSSLNKDTDEPLVKTLTMETLTGGPSLVFAMARRMLFWDNDNDRVDEDEDADGSYPRRRRSNNNRNRAKNNRDNNDKARPRPRRIPRPREKIVPRWHPHDGIADANPSFRMQPPAMNNRGYASTIRRNSRKRGKVSLWRHALRMYDKMKAEELEQRHLIQTKQRHPSTATILRSTEHFEAASVACAKLGLWREALGIYREIVEMGTNGGREDLDVTDNLVLSLVGACVRAARMRRKQGFGAEEQRAPLDAVRKILVGLEVEHGIPIRSSHVNPLAAAYQHLGLTVESAFVVQTFLVDRSGIPPVTNNIDDDDDDENENDDINDNESVVIVDTRSKDKASYNILVQGAILEGNWTMAIDSLRNMTEAGLYPNSRNLNIWSETAKKRELRGGGRRMRSWKKKRERMLVRGTLPPAQGGGNLPPGP